MVMKGYLAVILGVLESGPKDRQLDPDIELVELRS
jgi:hypothetical protein